MASSSSSLSLVGSALVVVGTQWPSTPGRQSQGQGQARRGGVRAAAAGWRRTGGAGGAGRLVGGGEVAARAREVTARSASDAIDASTWPGVAVPAGGGFGDDDDAGRGRGGGGGDGAGGDGAAGAGGFGGDGRMLGFAEAAALAAQRGVDLPADVAAIAKSSGISLEWLQRYLDMQGLPMMGALVRGSRIVRDRMVADPKYLFKVFSEVAIDSGCATFAEVKKRGKDFWAEFELYASDLLVGIVMDVAIVTLLAPVAAASGSMGSAVVAGGQFAALLRYLNRLPSSFFEKAPVGRVFTATQRTSTIFVKGGQYAGLGLVAGFIGQGIANSAMMAKRQMAAEGESHIPVPDLGKTALLWGAFMGLSSNLRYQLVNGAERVLESRFPQVSYAGTIAVRFANNIYGGMQFVDWARMSGVQ
eukprot:jgi/Chlat1/4190/Chrsp27S04237